MKRPKTVILELIGWFLTYFFIMEVVTFLIGDFIIDFVIIVVICMFEAVNFFMSGIGAYEFEFMPYILALRPFMKPLLILAIPISLFCGLLSNAEDQINYLIGYFESKDLIQQIKIGFCPYCGATLSVDLEVPKIVCSGCGLYSYEITEDQHKFIKLHIVEEVLA